MVAQSHRLTTREQKHRRLMLEERGRWKQVYRGQLRKVKGSESARTPPPPPQSPPQQQPPPLHEAVLPPSPPAAAVAHHLHQRDGFGVRMMLRGRTHHHYRAS